MENSYRILCLLERQLQSSTSNNKRVRIKVDDSHDWIVGYKKVKSDNGFFYVIHMSEDYK